ncbi:MAG: ORF6N domain-containing protein [Bacteroidota bacterium]|nr:ORF6N domain-containing protein [Bacteroidota bacterium]
MKTEKLIQLEIIQQRIFLIRGQKVMLGPHLAELYDIETRVLMQAVKRNLDRFPDDFMFPLTREEIMGISQIVTSLKYSKAVYAFTEHGVAMLSSVLNSSRAVQMNIAIMRTFGKLREILSTHKELAHKLAELERKIEKHDTQIQAIFEAIRRLMQPEEKPKRQIGFRVEEPKVKYKLHRKK